ncbi:MAG: hypothetical protein QOH06_1106 [Acidobacteriota bacterium]|nr:hypothetical protein [Acidobacteriota bacterium]
MKKKMKKLVLNRETLVHLEQSLGQIAGGVSYAPCGSASCPDICTFSGGARTCNTCDNHTCQTNFC